MNRELKSTWNGSVQIFTKTSALEPSVLTSGVVVFIIFMHSDRQPCGVTVCGTVVVVPRISVSVVSHKI